ncbi:hypothetical protein ACGF0J_19925 [Nonomuraea sp. NPDC047897]|uniref:hypothetical protein n=1 Tax=Nonomuraea sp. NPDC047897 TaxID=3364346 RepID=UPI00371FA711
MATLHDGADLAADALYAWAVNAHGRGACGVADRPDIATGRLKSAFASMPDGPASGSVRQVRVDVLANSPGYTPGRVLMRAHRDESAGALVFEAGER